MEEISQRKKSVSDDVFIFQKNFFYDGKKYYFKMRIFWHVVGWFGLIRCPRNRLTPV